MARNPRIVRVSSDTGNRDALSEPQFLVEGADGKLYLTVAVLEFDRNHPGITDTQTSSIDKLESLLAGGRQLKAVDFGDQRPAASQLEEPAPEQQMARLSFANIDPRHSSVSFANIDPNEAFSASTNPPR